MNNFNNSFDVLKKLKGLLMLPLLIFLSVFGNAQDSLILKHLPEKYTYKYALISIVNLKSHLEITDTDLFKMPENAFALIPLQYVYDDANNFLIQTIKENDVTVDAHWKINERTFLDTLNNILNRGGYYPFYPAYMGVGVKYYDSIKQFNTDSMLHSNTSNAEKDSISNKIKFKSGALQAKIEFVQNSIVIHLINATDTSYKFIVQDGWIPMIREAMNDSGNWQPIEYWLWNWCGFGYSFDSLQSNEQFIIKTFSYGGSYCTKIRFKLLLNNSVIYSDFYEGQINKSQFLKREARSYAKLFKSYLD